MTPTAIKETRRQEAIRQEKERLDSGRNWATALMPKKYVGIFDMEGNTISEGCRVVRASFTDVGSLSIQTVTKIKTGKIFLDNSTQPMKHPSRLLVLDW